MQGASGAGLSTGQHFGNAEATNGSLLFQGNVHGDLTINHRSTELQKLPPAAFNSIAKQHVPLCLQGTRFALLTQIKTWADGDGERRIYWLKGMAGTGKSTVALTIAREYYGNERLGASFFFSRGGGDLASVRNFAATIASQLRETSPEIRRRIDDAFASSHRVYDLGLYDQWEKLVLRPLSQLDQPPFSYPLVIVVDALDECNDQDDVRMLIQCLAAATTIESIQLRVFVTSRPDQPINLGFNGVSKESHLDVILHDIEQSIVDHDLYLYYRDRLEEISGRTSIVVSEPTLQCLVRKSNGLFIHAATVCRFLRDGGQLANERLSLLLEVGDSPTKPEIELDQMYTTVLSYSFPGKLDDNERTRLRGLFSRIVGSIVVLFDVMSPTSLVMLLDESKTDIVSTLSHLHSVLDVPELEDKPVRLLHPSLRDFLLDSERCSDQRFSINAVETHSRLLDCCLRIMSRHLRKNICNLQHPGTRATQNSKPEVDRRIPLPVQYACRYWIYHLQRSNIDPKDHPDIRDFFRTRFLFWLEALSLIGRLSDGITMVKILEAMLINATTRPSKITTRVKSKWKQLRTASQSSLPLFRMVYDAKRFILSHASIIEEAPLQIYCSALMFSPEASTTRQQYSSQVPNWILQRPSISKTWSPYLQILRGHSSSVTAVAFSPDGKLVASGSDDETVRLWDATTGTERRILKGHSDSVTAVAFSPDGKLVASGSGDETIRLWDATTGIEQRILKGHSGRVTAVAFSPDGKLVASGSDDETVRLWDATTGIERRILKGHSDSVTAVAFSPDGKLVASGSDDKTIRLWDATTGTERRILKGHSGRVTAVAFSPDGKLVASGSWDETIRLWDATTGTERRILKGHSGWVTAVAFSPDGKLVASGSDDETIRLWDATTGTERRILKGQSDAVTAVAFSPDGKLVASGSYDKTVRLWDATTGTERRILKGQSDAVTAVAFSPDGKLVASGSYDKTVRLWDATTGTERRILKGHSDAVTAVAFSPDGKLVASGSWDETVRLWDATTGLERYVYTLGVALKFLYFSSDSKCLVTDRGILRLLLYASNVSTRPLLFASRTWIKEDGEDLLRIHPNYQDSLLFIAKDIALFTDDLGCSTVLHLSHAISP